MNERPRVLIVDHQPDFIKLVRDTLESSSYQVLTASDRKSGLEMAKKETPSLVIVGALQPRGDSFRLHKELRDSPGIQNIPMLVIDVRPEEHLHKGWSRREGMQMCAEDYMSRPIEPVDLVLTVKRILERTTSVRPVYSGEVLEWMEEALKRVEKLEESLSN